MPYFVRYLCAKGAQFYFPSLTYPAIFYCAIFRILEHCEGAANLRERTRMRVLSKAFGKLKLMLPWVPPDTKLSKLDTLRLATSYISHLQKILDDNGGDFNENNTENSLKNYNNASLGCWPYGHHRLMTSRSSSVKSQDDFPSEEERPIYNSETYFSNN